VEAVERAAREERERLKAEAEKLKAEAERLKAEAERRKAAAVVEELPEKPLVSAMFKRRDRTAAAPSSTTSVGGSSSFRVGQEVQAVWREDGEWYAAVVEAAEAGMYTVMFTEYGNQQTETPPEQIRALAGTAPALVKKKTSVLQQTPSPEKAVVVAVNTTTAELFALEERRVGVIRQRDALIEDAEEREAELRRAIGEADGELAARRATLALLANAPELEVLERQLKELQGELQSLAAQQSERSLARQESEKEQREREKERRKKEEELKRKRREEERIYKEKERERAAEEQRQKRERERIARAQEEEKKKRMQEMSRTTSNLRAQLQEEEEKRRREEEAARRAEEEEEQRARDEEAALLKQQELLLRQEQERAKRREEEAANLEKKRREREAALAAAKLKQQRDEVALDDADLAELDSMAKMSSSASSMPKVVAPAAAITVPQDDSVLEDHELDLVAFMAKRGVAPEEKKEEGKKEEEKEEEPPKSPQMGSKSPKISTLRNKLGKV
jgi:hypothetical protein